LNLVDLAGS